MNAHTSLIIGAAFALAPVGAALIGCSDPTAGHTQWDSLSEEEAVRRLGSPTGTLKGTLPTSTRQALEQPMPGLFEAGHYLGEVVTTLDDLAQEDLSAFEAELPASTEPKNKTNDATWSTNLYLRLACPGDSIDPPFDFDDGEVRIESPAFDGLDVLSLVEEGEFLLSFDDCDLGPLDVSARIPSRFLSPQSDLVATLFDDPNFIPKRFIAMDMSDVESSSLGIVAVACGSASTSCRNDVLVAAEVRVANAGSYVLWFRGTREMWYNWLQQGSLASVTFRVGLIAADVRGSCEATYDESGVSLACDD